MITEHCQNIFTVYICRKAIHKQQSKTTSLHKFCFVLHLPSSVQKLDFLDLNQILQRTIEFFTPLYDYQQEREGVKYAREVLLI